ncbi:MAG: hypothetical protein COW02_02300 [Comamonadaceae bacterium CG12_big_fil_rev_8_21_14_0_65_59_15]|nr:MAG: hypothetical protein COW02_02300 [Comamonadaceae bacterium CG12_big_fil_rev_8_21_14_0_65_59_15]
MGAGYRVAKVGHGTRVILRRCARGKSATGFALRSFPPRVKKIPAASCGVSGADETIRLTGVRRTGETPQGAGNIPAVISGHKPSATAEKQYKVRPLELLRVHHEKIEVRILEQAGLVFDAKSEPGKLRVVA